MPVCLVVTGKIFDHMFCNLTKVFDRLQAANLKRSTLFANQVTYIGHLVPDKVQRQTLVCLTYFRLRLASQSFRHFLVYSDIVINCTMSIFLDRQGKLFVWTRKCQETFNCLKHQLTYKNLKGQPANWFETVSSFDVQTSPRL